MKLYRGPRTCAIGIHVLPNEIGELYETKRIDVEGSAARKPPFPGVTPEDEVPTLVRDNGTVLTEFGAIAIWLARTDPEGGESHRDHGLRGGHDPRPGLRAHGHAQTLRAAGHRAPDGRPRPRFGQAADAARSRGNQ